MNSGTTVMPNTDQEPADCMRNSNDVPRETWLEACQANATAAKTASNVYPSAIQTNLLATRWG